MVNDIQRRRNCYHEAGHAAAWVINGDALQLVVGDPDAPLTEEQKEIWDQVLIAYASPGIISAGKGGEHGGCTVAQTNNHHCPRCDGAIDADPITPSIARFHLSAECPECMQLLTNHIACIFAGWAATSHLDSDVEILASICKARPEVQFDRQQAFSILESFCPKVEADRMTEEAYDRATEWMEREWNAVSALAKALYQERVLDGPVAERLIRENLTVHNLRP